jgi:hypothetical protein
MLNFWLVSIISKSPLALTLIHPERVDQKKVGNYRRYRFLSVEPYGGH